MIQSPDLIKIYVVHKTVDIPGEKIIFYFNNDLLNIFLLNIIISRRLPAGEL